MQFCYLNSGFISNYHGIVVCVCGLRAWYIYLSFYTTMRKHCLLICSRRVFLADQSEMSLCMFHTAYQNTLLLEHASGFSLDCYFYNCQSSMLDWTGVLGDRANASCMLLDHAERNYTFSLFILFLSYTKRYKIIYMIFT